MISHCLELSKMYENTEILSLQIALKEESIQYLNLIITQLNVSPKGHQPLKRENKAKMNKPVYLRFQTLDLTKIQLYKSCYDRINKR